jgi:hypothetical protein
LTDTDASRPLQRYKCSFNLKSGNRRKTTQRRSTLLSAVTDTVRLFSDAERAALDYVTQLTKEKKPIRTSLLD